MIWNGWLDLSAVDGYTLYVWGAYAVAPVLIVMEVILLLLRQRTILEHLGRVHGATKT
jgi:heme exporter protein CcmD